MRALAFTAGIALDARWGDPPTQLHPVALLGSAINALHARAPRGEYERLRYGALTAVGLPLAAAAVTILARRLAAQIPLGGAVCDALLLNATSALHTLLARALEIEAALEAGDLAAARTLCGMHLVSRDTSALTSSEVAGATIESVAENLSDGVVAPWLAFALGGAPAAAAYRAANTLDSLWGYHDAEFEALGKAGARLDDALNVVPSRLTALAIIAASAMPCFGASADAFEALACWRTDAQHTASPNAGHPMAAMAGALNVRLVKYGAYALGDHYRDPEAADISRAVGLARGAASLVGAGMLGALVLTGAPR
jgi:adenosylcobinamide-phosphate synthase